MRPSAQLLFSDPAHFIALGGGIGLVRKLPGTAGSLLGLAIFFATRQIHWGSYLTFLVVLIIIGTLAAHRSARLLRDKDPSCIVIDEIAGMLLAASLLPSGNIWPWIAFMLFRVFDIVKPWPVNLADQHVAGGFGIMLDDLVAAVYVILIVQLLVYLNLSF